MYSSRLATLIDDGIITSVREPTVNVPKKTHMDIIRHFHSGLSIQVESSYNTDLNVITEDTSTHTYSVSNVKLIAVYLGRNRFQYDVSTSEVVKNEDSANIVKNGDTIDITINSLVGRTVNGDTITQGVYCIDLSNASSSGTVSFFNDSVPSNSMIH